MTRILCPDCNGTCSRWVEDQYVECTTCGGRGRLTVEERHFERDLGLLVAAAGALVVIGILVAIALLAGGR